MLGKTVSNYINVCAGGLQMSVLAKLLKSSSFIFSIILCAGLAGVPSSAQAAGQSCNGLVASITSSARVINGTSGADVIVVQGSGVHSVNSGNGNDVICGSVGDDTINSGPGNDTVLAGDGNDVISSLDGNDTVNGGSGNDTISGGAGKDTISGGAGKDAISGGDDPDRLNGDAGTDSLSGGAGNDTLQGGSDKDYLNPGAGTNYCASDSADSIVGSCTIDSSGPGVSNASVTPSVAAGSTLTFIWSVNDNSAIDSSWVKIAGPSGWVTTWCGFGLEGTRVSGTNQGSVFSAKCQVPLDAVNTEYTAFFDATDVFGLMAQSSTATFRIIGGATDSSAPVVTNIALSSATLTYGQTLNITYDVADETGLQGVIAWVALNGYGFANNEGRSYVDYGSYAINRTSGDEKDGKYLQQITLNNFAPSGEYTLWISVIDKLGNKVFYQTSTKFTVN